MDVFPSPLGIFWLRSPATLGNNLFGSTFLSIFQLGGMLSFFIHDFFFWSSFRSTHGKAKAQHTLPT